MAALTNARLKALRAALDAFTNFQKMLAPPSFPDEGFVEAVYQLVQETGKRAPKVLPAFNRLAYSDPMGNVPVQTNGLRAYIVTAISILGVAIEDDGFSSAERLLDFAYVRSQSFVSFCSATIENYYEL